MKVKALLIAITLAAAVGQANAAYDTPSGKNGPLILAAWVPTAVGGTGAGDSIVIGLGISLQSFLPGTVAAQTPQNFGSITQSLLQGLFGTTLNAGLIWNVSAADSSSPPLGTGFRFAYSSSGPTPSPTNSNIFNATQNANSFIGQQNAVIPTTGCTNPAGNTGSCASTNSADGRNVNNSITSKWGSNYGISGIFNGSAGPGQSLGFFYATAGSTSGTTGNSNTQYMQAGGANSLFALDTAGVLTWTGSALTAVPEPASVTTLLAGLAFLVGVVRRRLAN